MLSRKGADRAPDLHNGSVAKSTIDSVFDVKSCERKSVDTPLAWKIDGMS
jgi:hypothetical protein